MEQQQVELAEIIQQCEALPSLGETDHNVLTIAREKMEENRQWIAQCKRVST